MASYADRRHMCIDGETHRKDRDESDHVHEDHDDHYSAPGSEACLVMFPLFHCTNRLYSQCSLVFVVSLASSLIGLNDPVEPL